jgi:exodeoxyribonuclease V beta subunit
MQPLDSLTFPLKGVSLIEASAGTGKTYTIVNLYLRQLLGHGCTPLNVDQILVVTFTNAATAELKERIRQRLQSAYLDFYRGSSDEPFIQDLYAQTDNKALATQRLALASKQMDEAAIFTIHGFCQRALTEHAFESGAMYEQEFILDESEWLKLAVADYWRSVIVTQPVDIQAMLLSIWSNPEQLRKAIQPLLNRKVTSYHNIDIASAVNLHQRYITEVASMKRWWLDEQLADLIHQAGFSGSSKVGKADNLTTMQAFCHSHALKPDLSDGWGLYAPANIEKGKKKGTVIPEVDFGRFERIAELEQKALNGIKASFSQDAMTQVAHNLTSQKSRLQLLSPDDLLSQLGNALTAKNEITHTNSSDNTLLASALRERYPSVLIDEFQDTDPLQYRIFSAIYGQALGPENLGAVNLNTENPVTDSPTNKPPCWIMIGDPKQAIYGFRGADIFTYIMAKQQVDPAQQFTLDTNWRSTPQLVEAVNTVFINNQQTPEQQQNLSFHPVKAGKDEEGLKLKGKLSHSLDFWHLGSVDDKPIAKGQAQQALAQICAAKIQTLLQSQSTVAGRALQAVDCCVLVRDRNEAQLLKNALGEQGVASVFLVRKSVFASQTALDCYRLLCALSHPGDDRQVKTALLTELFAMQASELDALFNNDKDWQDIIALFHQWHQDWQKHGLMMALNKVSIHFRLEQKAIKVFADGLRRVTDLRHVLELLQQRSLQVQGQGQLLHWFSQCLQEPDHSSDNQQLRLETDANLVQICTLHASKGLQYPLVFMPFGNTYRSARDAVFHGESGALQVDFLGSEKFMAEAEQERLAEDIRLLYVALTRAQYYCAVGVWHNISDDKRRQSAFLTSALGALLLPAGVKVSDQQIGEQIIKLGEQANIAYTYFAGPAVEEINTLPVESNLHAVKDALKPNLVALHLHKPVERQWRLTSYSALSQQQAHLEVILPGMDEGQDRISQDDDDGVLPDNSMSAFSFEKGANAGSFLHGVLENIDFSQADSLAPAIAQQSSKFAIDEQWHALLNDWLSDVLLTPFNPPFTQPMPSSTKLTAEAPILTLARLDKQQIKVEMEFYMPLKSVQVQAFNQLINHYMPHYVRHYEFAQLNGMLKGFIDLTFAFNGKYYVADYKSNHLGNDYADYQLASLERAMHEHDYHLQAILYTLALHRWLKNQLPNYQYQQHIGGAYYLFLRGMHSTKAASGVYHYLAEEAFIVALDRLFSGEQTAELSSTPSAVKTSDSVNNDDEEGQLSLW